MKVNIRNCVMGEGHVNLHDVELSTVPELDFFNVWTKDILFRGLMYDEQQFFGYIMAEFVDLDNKKGVNFIPVAIIEPAEAVRELGIPKFDPKDYIDKNKIKTPVRCKNSFIP